MQKQTRITNKYDLMHLNTPSFATTTVTWDTSKLSELTFKRVVQALKAGFIKYRTGDAVAMYEAIRKQFEIPVFKLDEPKPTKKGDSWHGGYIHWEFATDKLMSALQPVYHAERVIRRLDSQNSGWMPWYLQDETLQPHRKYFYFENPHDLSEVKLAIDEIVNSPEVANKRRDAINFLQDGGKLEFTWR